MKTLKIISIVLSIIVSLYFINKYIIEPSKQEKKAKPLDKPQNTDVLAGGENENLNTDTQSMA